MTQKPKKLEYSTKRPLNEEPPLEKLVQSFITTKGYDRNHGPIPHIDAATHYVSVFGEVENEASLSIDDLKALPQHSIVCALQCAGNRRHTMRTKMKEVSGIDWFDGAVMNCKWSGPLLKDVLETAGITIAADKYSSAHVAFSCFQTPCEDDEFYGASIPLTRALDASSSVLLALSMNDAPLTPNHGAPVRIVTPGIAGARSVKWLDRITVQKKESSNYYQQLDYKILPPEADTKAEAAKWWSRVPAIQGMPVNSVIALPKSNTKLTYDKNGCVQVMGYALPSGDDGPVTKVEVSTDDGKTWIEASLKPAEPSFGKDEHVDLKWAWTLWEARVPVERAEGVMKKIISRATDRGGNMQEKSPEWNFRGVAYNGYGEVTNLETA